MKSKKIISIIGLGYVGLPLLAYLSKHYIVIGFDTDQKRIDQLKKKYDKNSEVSFKSLKFSNISFTSRIDDIKNCDIYIITVPTPVYKNKKPNISLIKKASKQVANIIREGNLVIYESTVYPGLTEEICIPILEKYSGLNCHKDYHQNLQNKFYVGYSPERVNPGDKTNSLENIVKIVSGSSKKSLNKVNEVYEKIIKAGTYRVSSIKVAEAAKIIENCQRDINIAFINELSIIFKKLNLDTNEVLDAASTKWNFIKFSPGLVGGHCIGVDPYYLANIAKKIGYNSKMILSGRKLNESMVQYCLRNLKKQIDENLNSKKIINIFYFGLTFKANCSDIRNSQSLKMLKILSKEKKYKITIKDPYLKEDQISYLSKKFSFNFDDLENIDHKIDIFLFAVDHEIFKFRYPLKKLINFSGSTKLLFDIKSIYSLKESKKYGFKIFRL